MKKTIITIGTLALMSFNTHCIYKQYQLSEALGTIQDMRTWMQEDINNDRIITDLGEFYIEKFNEVEDQIIQFTDANNIMTVDFECDGYEVDSNGVVTNF
ncbi:MAG: hypothetical protein HRU31_18480 [Rhodobacteraceae bacterium]|nr:hypothetical protein [Paracoccaceae bacterium]